MIHLHGIEKSFGGTTLFSDLSWHISPGARIALVGPNGAGKTTLFRILAGELAPDEGERTFPKDRTIGFLRQEVDPCLEGTVLAETMLAFGEVLSLRTRIEEIESLLSVEEDQALLAELGYAQARMEQIGGYDAEARAKRVLSGLGFGADRIMRPASELSGGWVVRIELARLLLRRPDLLILDEPTNHLDVPSLEWFEGFLEAYEGALVIISHDRWFINRMATRIAELSPGGLWLYEGNYDDFLRQRDERQVQHEKRIREQEKKIETTERYIERFRYKASKAKGVQARIRALEKMDRLERTEESASLRSFQFSEAPRSGRMVLEISDVVKRYGDFTVYDGVNLQVERGERIALVGPNGAGKTTLLKLMAGVLSVEAGEINLGHNVILSYFAQHQVEALDEKRTVLEEMEAGARIEDIPRVRSTLGAFLFRGDDVKKKVAVLSGGEKSRLALAKILLAPSNLLLLDEPTNHLDLRSREVLEQALALFKGTLCFISHDRSFISGIANKVIDVQAGELAVYPGDFSYYLYKRKEEEAEDSSEAWSVEDGGEDSHAQAPVGRKERKRFEAELRNALHRDTKETRERLEEIEKEIAELEERKEEIGAQQEDPDLYKDPDRMKDVFSEQRGCVKRLDALYEEWEMLGQKLEASERAFQESLREAVGDDAEGQ